MVFIEVHCNTFEGMWTDVRNFLRPFKSGHKRYLFDNIAVCEFRRNLRHISISFISQLFRFHTFYLCASFLYLFALCRLMFCYNSDIISNCFVHSSYP
jgi:hypothetical protein